MPEAGETNEGELDKRLPTINNKRNGVMLYTRVASAYSQCSEHDALVRTSVPRTGTEP